MKNKKILSVLALVAILFAVSGCTSKPKEESMEGKALSTDAEILALYDAEKLSDLKAVIGDFDDANIPATLKVAGVSAPESLKSDGNQVIVYIGADAVNLDDLLKATFGENVSFGSEVTYVVDETVKIESLVGDSKIIQLDETLKTYFLDYVDEFQNDTFVMYFNEDAKCVYAGGLFEGDMSHVAFTIKPYEALIKGDNVDGQVVNISDLGATVVSHDVKDIDVFNSVYVNINKEVVIDTESELTFLLLLPSGVESDEFRDVYANFISSHEDINFITAYVSDRESVSNDGAASVEFNAMTPGADIELGSEITQAELTKLVGDLQLIAEPTVLVISQNKVTAGGAGLLTIEGLNQLVPVTE